MDGVIHFAASAYVGESVLEPRKYFHNNVVNTLALLDAMLEAGVDQIVFSSTCATTASPTTCRSTEDTLSGPSIRMATRSSSSSGCWRPTAHAYGLRWVALRYFNAAGADPDGELGEDHDPETHLIPLAIEAALGQPQHVDIFGTDYPTPDGTAVRDYIHVTDLADAHVRALGYLEHGGASLALNLGTGRGHSVREVIATVERVGRRPVPVRRSAAATGRPAGAGRAIPACCRGPRLAAQHANLESIMSAPPGRGMSAVRQRDGPTDEPRVLQRQAIERAR